MSEDLQPLVETTGELVPAPADLTVETLRTYARARVARDALIARRAEHIAMLADTELRVIESELAEADAVVRSVECLLAETFSDETRAAAQDAITVDVGAVRVTWGKPRERWTQRVKPKTIAETDADLAFRLGIEKTTDSPPKPRITVRPEKIGE